MKENSAPLRFVDFVGNQNLVELLWGKTLPPASIFAGPKGIGKATLAISLAALANCDQKHNGDLCGHCPSCMKVRSRNHPDVFFFDYNWIETFLKSRKKRPNPRVIPVDVIRELIREVQFRPYQGNLRVFILDEAHKLNKAAANSILKTLEEPSSTTRLVLLTPFPQSLLPTILSRCQLFTFGRLSQNEVTRYIKQRSIGSEDPELRAALSDGSIGTALALDLKQMRTDRDRLLNLIQQWIENPIFSSLFRIVESSGLSLELKNRERVLELLLLLQRLAEDLYFLIVGTPKRIKNIDYAKKLQLLASGLTLSWVKTFLASIREALTDVEAYVNPSMCFETLWLKIELKQKNTFKT